MDANYATRLQWFRQFKQHVNASTSTLIAGIDIGKDTHHAFLGTPAGVTIHRRLIFENTVQRFDKLLVLIQGCVSDKQLSEVVIGVEPTSVYHKPLCEYLISIGYHVVYVTNTAIKKNRAILDGRWDKNDTKDSANVADLVSRGRCHFYDLPDMDLRDIRSLLSLRKRLKKQEHRLMTRIRNNLVAQYFPELDRAWYHCGQENLSIVRFCLTPETIASLGFNEFCRMVTRTRRGVRQYQRLRYIYDVAAYSIGCRPGASVVFEAQLLVDNLERSREQIREVEDQLHAMCKSYKEYELLQTIPGFGPYVSAVVLGAIGYAQRFDNAKQVLRLAGLDLNAMRSGKSGHNAVPVISKVGKADLRYALYQAAKVATSRTAEFKAYFKRILKGRDKERGIKTKMRVKVSAKMLVIAWTLMKTMQPYKAGLLFTDEPDHPRGR
ncbi:MAG: IS110 family transposase [Deltaproteobacteria bacterium]|jgi:transposase|nr:IS110 family transposase [Deltaproteobacteria bacterium]